MSDSDIPAKVPVGDARAVELTTEAVRRVTDIVPELALVLGSGLGPLAEEIEEATAIDYADLPGMPVSTAPGHAGRLVLGHLAGRTVVAMQGRVHPYEGFSAQECSFPVAVMHALGARGLVVTNACGGLDPAFEAGDLMLQLDYVNATGRNPLIGPNDDERYPRFPVMFDCYDPGYVRTARRVALSEGIPLREGVYLAITGPSYASRAELRAYRTLGADAIGMSTVFEVIRARHLGMRVLGISTVTDMALPDRNEHATGDEVLAVAARTGATFRRLVRAVLPEL
ncbi:MAG TPA: purine-nucleoside phosphorylase [Trueperaceae bacterium]|jgi:purine-nucleoside phosphorylase|nr:purine-nucleoside phosphorylase [Trueperaceae bacterium]